MWTAFIVISLLAFATFLTIVMVLVVPLPGTHHPKPVEVGPVADSKHPIEPPDRIAPSTYRSRTTQEFRPAGSAMSLTVYPPTGAVVEADCLDCLDKGIALVDEESLRLVKWLPCGSCCPISRKAALRRAGR